MGARPPAYPAPAGRHLRCGESRSPHLPRRAAVPGPRPRHRDKRAATLWPAKVGEPESPSYSVRSTEPSKITLPSCKAATARKWTKSRKFSMVRLLISLTSACRSIFLVPAAVSALVGSADSAACRLPLASIAGHCWIPRASLEPDWSLSDRRPTACGMCSVCAVRAVRAVRARVCEIRPRFHLRFAAGAKEEGGNRNGVLTLEARQPRVTQLPTADVRNSPVEEYEPRRISTWPWSSVRPINCQQQLISPCTDSPRKRGKEKKERSVGVFFYCAE